MQSEILTALVSADKRAAKSCTITVFYAVKLSTLLSKFDRILEYLAVSDERFIEPYYCNFATRLLVQKDRSQHEFSIWLENGNAYSITGLTDSPHLCTLSLYQLCTATMTDQILQGAQVYFDTLDIPAILGLHYEKIKLPLFSYDYRQIKPYLQHTRQSLETILHSKDHGSFLSLISRKKRILRTFDLLFGYTALVAVEAGYCVEAESPRSSHG